MKKLVGTSVVCLVVLCAGIGAATIDATGASVAQTATTSPFHHPGTPTTTTTTSKVSPSQSTTSYATHTPTKTVVWSARLTAAQEIPKQVVVNTKGHGTFSATLTGSTLRFTLTFAGLSGPALAAHLHMGAMGKSGPVVVPLCTACSSPVKKTVTVSAAVKAAFAKHLLYVNVHTAKNPNGEIRGQLGM